MTQKEKLIWVAGFFDGEGSICINKPSHGVVSLSQAIVSLLEEVRDVMLEEKVVGGPIRPFQFSSRVYYLNYYNVRGSDFLTKVLPFLCCPKRKRRAKLYLEAFPLGTLGECRKEEKQEVYIKWLELRVLELNESHINKE